MTSTTVAPEKKKPNRDDNACHDAHNASSPHRADAAAKPWRLKLGETGVTVPVCRQQRKYHC